MKSDRVEKLNDFFKNEISSLLITEIRDPDIGFVTITKVEIAKELDIAKVFFSGFDTEEKKINRDKLTKALFRAKGFLKSQLAKKIKLRRMPDLTFIYDDSIEHAQHIANILTDIKKNENSDE